MAQYTEQYRVLKEIQDAGFNVCTCGNCGDVVLFDEEMIQADEIKCPHCDAVMDYADYPDLYSYNDK